MKCLFLSCSCRWSGPIRVLRRCSWENSWEVRHWGEGSVQLIPHRRRQGCSKVGRETRPVDEVATRAPAEHSAREPGGHVGTDVQSQEGGQQVTAEFHSKFFYLIPLILCDTKQLFQFFLMFSTIVFIVTFMPQLYFIVIFFCVFNIYTIYLHYHKRHTGFNEKVKMSLTHICSCSQNRTSECRDRIPNCWESMSECWEIMSYCRESMSDCRDSMSDCRDKTKGLVGKLSELTLIQRKPHGNRGGTDGLALGLILEI